MAGCSYSSNSTFLLPHSRVSQSWQAKKKGEKRNFKCFSRKDLVLLESVHEDLRINQYHALDMESDPFSSGFKCKSVNRFKKSVFNQIYNETSSAKG